ncbi:D-sorbitol dehydrogenase (acceptor) [Rhizobium leguminosarum]|uniref:D-sorbitol dehydrogenase (Acceptor) n=1 Tax=Rhizobium leguminosarum TaxID=384 RepID=A0AAE2MFV2_RHILE|nr:MULTISPECIES: L-iditol 2-dehydrogenase [Rhizobium]MBB4288405.1 D-sorbitol dehydrogenase (acceptor) [Rhizobium leguminosarum]MBB4295502.1 D-sorbitol dehydrogenase (acceptor) [Rhizobium leguminosarum]MBB4306896.1 D-sorbitol dehydrogenase (acceptor) [Rhizobium leguminosarum]MBB4417522.1 D-sorbitol dehydrogenase (acceptor) [Rhizobium leguminosarum]MBB4432366.1 D-sorbitol dehydrogenase (acceptor) [Rhizobium esperanzae]
MTYTETERLSGKVALVTGGASGIGKAVCERFAAEGARVVVADLDGERCARVAETIGPDAWGVALDVTSQDSIEEAARFTISTAGQIDILVNAAGIYDVESILEISRERTARVFQVNIEGLIFMTQAVARHMVERGEGGRIINFSSQAGRRGEGPAVAYCASKAAVISITQSCALELIRYGINVNAIAPGVVDTPMWDVVDAKLGSREGLKPGDVKRRVAAAVPAGRFGAPQEQAAMAAFLAGPDAAYIVAQCYNVDGGNVMS